MTVTIKKMGPDVYALSDDQSGEMVYAYTSRSYSFVSVVSGKYSHLGATTRIALTNIAHDVFPGSSVEFDGFIHD